MWGGFKGKSGAYVKAMVREMFRHPAILAQLSSSVDQIPGTTNPTAITFDTQDTIVGITHSTSVDPSEITIDTGGIYCVFPQPQVGKTSGASKLDFDMFIQVDREDGSGFVDEPRTTVRLVIKDFDITDVVPLAFCVSLNARDKIRIMQKVSSTTGGLGLKAAAAVVGPPTVPAMPSIIFMIHRVGA